MKFRAKDKRIKIWPLKLPRIQRAVDINLNSIKSHHLINNGLMKLLYLYYVHTGLKITSC